MSMVSGCVVVEVLTLNIGLLLYIVFVLLLLRQFRIEWVCRYGTITYLESNTAVGYGPACPLVIAVRLQFTDPVLYLLHQLKTLQVKMLVYNLE